MELQCNILRNSSVISFSLGTGMNMYFLINHHENFGSGKTDFEKKKLQINFDKHIFTLVSGLQVLIKETGEMSFSGICTVT